MKSNNYQNRHWIKREADDGKKEVYEIYTVSRKNNE